jgi:hypothetical protein
MTPATRALAAALVLFGTACVPRRPEPPTPEPVSTVIYVSNRGYADVAVYLADGNTPRRLGTVVGLGRARLRIPNQMAALGVRLLVRVRDSREWHATDAVLPGAGGVLALTVNPLLAASELSILAYGALEPEGAGASSRAFAPGRTLRP